MVLSAPSLWWPRLAAFVLAALAAASAVMWWLRMGPPAQASGIAAVAAPTVPPDAVAVARALGAAMAKGNSTALSQPAPGLESARFALQGVVAQSNTQGAALLSIDGKAAKPYAVGAKVVDGWTLQAVQGRRATLSRNGAEMVLDLPALVSPSSTPPTVAVDQPAIATTGPMVTELLPEARGKIQP